MNLGKLGQALTSREIFGLIQDELAAVEKKIGGESVASVHAVTAIGQYLHSSGGKRLRPALLLLSAKLAGNGGTSAVNLGAVVEMIHAATLVHDDVIDAAQTRRGRSRSPCASAASRSWTC
jgi:octaprenyl-diphosphate synthase